MSSKDFKFIDLEKCIPSLVLDIRYATENNFAGRRLYPSAKAYLRRPVAAKLAEVQKALKKQKLGLKVFDAYRPLAVQRKMWEMIPDERYVADPAKGSKHNRGAAIDVALVDQFGRDLPMPSEYDDFTSKAHRNYNDLPKEMIANRALLEEVMVSQGFLPFPTEWWHFDDRDWLSYPVEDLSFEEIEA